MPAGTWIYPWFPLANHQGSSEEGPRKAGILVHHLKDLSLPTGRSHPSSQLGANASLQHASSSQSREAPFCISSYDGREGELVKETVVPHHPPIHSPFTLRSILTACINSRPVL